MKHYRAHPYLTGNFAPVQRQLSLEPCRHYGQIPRELIGGQYVRNGGNQLVNEDLDRDAHWFDGDGMLSGVYFRPIENGNCVHVQPEYSNRYILTDVFQATSEAKEKLRLPLLPSVTTLTDPMSSLVTILKAVLRTLFYVLCSFIRRKSTPIKRISVANTSIIHHDGRVLATCESGPPMRVFLPELKTVGWFNAWFAEGESVSQKSATTERGFGGNGLLSFFKEWTTGHPHVDPQTGEMMLLHSTFVRPFLRYSIISRPQPSSKSKRMLIDIPVPGMTSAKMLHDFGASRKHTVIIEPPLSLDPFNLVYNKPVVSYEPTGHTRFGVFPRWDPKKIVWFATHACCIFHTANTWDGTLKEWSTVNMLVCRMTSASIVYSSGNIPPPSSDNQQSEECRLYYYQFITDGPYHGICQEWALSGIPLEFPHVPKHLSMSPTRFVYGCSMVHGSFSEQLGKATKIDCLVKLDVQKLISRGLSNPPPSVSGCVDERSVEEVLASKNPNDTIHIFQMPENWYAQECTFVPRVDGVTEDDGWLLTFVFDESQLDSDGNASDDACSELWIIDAKEMKDVVSRILIPQRVPYGLHGNWFTKDEINQQRRVDRFRY